MLLKNTFSKHNLRTTDFFKLVDLHLIKTNYLIISLNVAYIT
jgi:hypothetical protein